jgi:glycosyltransferase involved in cell wall biosynthesis
MSVGISLVVNTLNEENNIGACINSTKKLVDEVIVVDMHSNDRTAEIARSLGAKVHLVERKPFVDPVRNFAIAQATGDWILLLDADERLTPELSSELHSIAEKDRADVVTIEFDTYISKQQIKYSGWQKDSHCRFFKKGFLEYPDREVHGIPKIWGRKIFLPKEKGKIQHFNFRDLRHLINKINDYSDGEAIKLLRTNAKISLLRGIYWGVRHFFKRYLKLRGYKDGKYGFILSMLMGLYWFLAFAKAWERNQRGYKQQSSKSEI